MDQILTGLLLSDKPDGLKHHMALKIAAAGVQNQPASKIGLMFSATTKFILDAEVAFSAELCKKVYVKWASYNRTSLEEFFNAKYIKTLMDGKYKHGTNAVWLLHETFLLLRGGRTYNDMVQVVEAKAIDFARGHPQDEILTAFCRFLFEFKECIPKGDLSPTFCVAIVHAVSAFSAPRDMMPQFVHNVSNVIGIFLRHIWHTNGSDCVMHSLKAIFKLISYVDESGAEPCIALGGIVMHIPLDMIDHVVKTTVSDNTILDVNMTAALLRMIDWLNWPLANNMDQWILAFLKGLAAVHKYTILINVTESKVEQVFDKLNYKVVRDSSMNVLSHMLLSFQHSPDAFHKIVQEVPATVTIIRREGGVASANCLDQFAELLHCLMALYPGFPDLYDKVVDAIKDYRKPSAEVIRLRLTQSKWTSQQKAENIGFSSRFAKKSETGKTGLVNLGNTCYMNSILQALFMCDSFRRDVCAAPISPQQSLLVKLQYVFAFLSMSQVYIWQDHTRQGFLEACFGEEYQKSENLQEALQGLIKRAAYSPSAFLKASRPPWFTPGHQQDCSEFLKYLLDQLHEQELYMLQQLKRSSSGPLNSSTLAPRNHTDTSRSRSSENINRDRRSTHGKPEVGLTLIKDTFGGQMRTTYRCLYCQNLSHRTEMFTDIPLAFPNQGISKKDAGGKGKAALVGGDPRFSCATRSGDPYGTDKVHLEEMLDYYLKPELLQGDNRYQCEKCSGLQEAERTLQIVQAPEYLIFTLLRFSYNTKAQSRSKIFTDVHCPRIIFVPINSHPSSAFQHGDTRKGRSKFYKSSSEEYETYCLCSVVIHSGTSSECGHYYCYARHSIPRNQTAYMETDNGEMDEDYLEDTWYLFNDSRVTYSSYSSFSNVTKKFAKDTVYVLVYRRICAETLEDNLMDPPLRRDLRETVERDNKLYLQEQELEARARAMQRKSPSTVATTASWYNWKDDDRNGPPGSCGGGGGLGGLDTSGSRFIF